MTVGGEEHFLMREEVRMSLMIKLTSFLHDCMLLLLEITGSSFLYVPYYLTVIWKCEYLAGPSKIIFRIYGKEQSFKRLHFTQSLGHVLVTF